MPKIVIESHIPYVGNAFAGVADTTFLPPEGITPEAVRDADALIVRTRTRCDAALLDGSRVRFVATATIGTDHIDLGYCRDNGIEVVSAPGCNAPAVAQYVWASVFTLRRDDWQGLTLGIVGLGHVGSIVADWARRLGVKVLACDPPRQRRDGGWNPAEPFASGSEPFVTLSDIAEKCDIITIHTPHTKTGRDATHHLADRRASCKPTIGYPLAFSHPGAVEAEAKHGDLTLARFDGDNGEYSLLLGNAKGIEGPYTKGTYLWIEVENWPRLEAKIVEGPYIHHCVGIHQDVVPVLYEACKYIGVKPDLYDDVEQQVIDTIHGVKRR